MSATSQAGASDLPVQSCGEERIGADEVWLVSAREFDGSAVPATSLLRCERLCDGQWLESNCDELFGNQTTGLQTAVFVHGYQTDLHDARRMGQQIYGNIFCGCQNRVPVRFVIWAWKSERETCRLIQDFSIMSRRAVGLGDIFALSLNELGPVPPVVIAYSLGAQVAVSALTQSTLYQGAPIQLVTIAAASDCGFASSCNLMSNCGAIERSVVFLNQGDRAVRAAKLVCRVTYGHGFEPFESFAPRHSNQLGQIDIVDITAVSSRRHSILLYTEIPVVQSCIRTLLAHNSGTGKAAVCDSAPGDSAPIANDSVELQVAGKSTSLDANHEVCNFR